MASDASQTHSAGLLRARGGFGLARAPSHSAAAPNVVRNVAPSHLPTESACASGAGVATPTERPPSCEECGRHGACVATTSCVPPLAPHTFPFPQTPTVAASSLVRAPPPPAHFYLRLLSASSWGYLSVAAAVRSRRRRCRAQQGLMHGFQSRFSIPPRLACRRCATR